MSRASRTLADLVPLAAVEPDGLLVTSDGALRAAARLRGGAAAARRRARAPRARSATGSARWPRAYPPGRHAGARRGRAARPRPRARARTGDEIDAAARHGGARGEVELAAALRAARRTGSSRRSAAAPPRSPRPGCAGRSPSRWRPRPRLVAACAIARAPSAVRTLERRAHERAAADSLRGWRARRGRARRRRLRAAGARRRPGAGGARPGRSTRRARRRRSLGAAAGARHDRPAQALAHRHALLAARCRRVELRSARDWLERTHASDDPRSWRR